MCPEFLREGVSVADFFEPPFVVVGTADEQGPRHRRELFAFLDRETQHVAVATAEALKYACNAFHATKVSFANELARVFRGFGVDSREVMRVFCEDTMLNISPTYLRPGFAFGGSCLPKDLRALQDMARVNGVDVPLLAGTSLTNELVIRDVVDRLIATGRRTVALLGLSFKMDTDDLRESPNVELAERLIGKGFEVRIYDPIINPERLVGANLRYVEARLPHLNRLLARTPRRRSRAPRSSSSPSRGTGRDRRAAEAAPCTSSTSPAGSAPRSNGCPATEGWAGDGLAARPDHRPEPAGPLRPAGLARVPHPARAGYDVTVVCPGARTTGAYQVLDGVDAPRYRPYAPGGSALGFVVEYALLVPRDVRAWL